MNIDSSFVRNVIEGNRYLTLATSDGENPWLAPLEYICDDALNLYFFSLVDSDHGQHIEANPQVAVAVFSPEQPEYKPGTTLLLRAVQMTAKAHRITTEFPPVVQSAIDQLRPPMPPYAVFRLQPGRCWVPIIREGMNERVEVELLT